ncbi:hypothetical protein D1872_300600 [compost metagenome]
MDKVHRTLGFQRGFKHRQSWRNADAAADQHQRLVARGQSELTRWWEQLNAGANLQLIVQVVGGTATRFAFDADAVLTVVRQCRQRVVAADLLAIEDQLHADVLTRFGRENRAFVCRL